MNTRKPMSWKLRAVIAVLGLASTAGSAWLQEGKVARLAFLVAACVWVIALGFLVKERLGKRGEE